jgi:hypothetical protein
MNAQYKKATGRCHGKKSPAAELKATKKSSVLCFLSLSLIRIRTLFTDHAHVRTQFKAPGFDLSGSPQTVQFLLQLKQKFAKD